jgi:hypothetical protein
MPLAGPASRRTTGGWPSPSTPEDELFIETRRDQAPAIARCGRGGARAWSARGTPERLATVRLRPSDEAHRRPSTTVRRVAPPDPRQRRNSWMPRTNGRRRRGAVLVAPSIPASPDLDEAARRDRGSLRPSNRGTTAPAPMGPRRPPTRAAHRRDVRRPGPPARPRPHLRFGQPSVSTGTSGRAGCAASLTAGPAPGRRCRRAAADLVRVPPGEAGQRGRPRDWCDGGLVRLRRGVRAAVGRDLGPGARSCWAFRPSLPGEPRTVPTGAALVLARARQGSPRTGTWPRVWSWSWPAPRCSPASPGSPLAPALHIMPRLAPDVRPRGASRLEVRTTRPETGAGPRRRSASCP